MPLYFALLSLPFLEEPCPFLCAMVMYLKISNLLKRHILPSLFAIVQKKISGSEKEIFDFSRFAALFNSNGNGYIISAFMFACKNLIAGQGRL
jgi:hypothetical protein